jgi:hypothetical protein
MSTARPSVAMSWVAAMRLRTRTPPSRSAVERSTGSAASDTRTITAAACSGRSHDRRRPMSGW